jgi:predicted amidohydrolase
MSSNETLTLVALQIEASTNLSDTLLQIQALLDQARTANETIDCALLPEYAFGTFREWATTKQDSDHLTASIQTAIGQLAQQNRVAIVAGSMPYQTEQKTWRNRSFIFSKSGELVGSYDKQHPFRVEKRLGLEPGTECPSFKLNGHNMAVLICSDLWYHDLLVQVVSTIDFLVVPTMTTVLNNQHIKYGQWAWQSLVGVRSKEYTIPIVSADQAAREYAPGIFTCGGSCVADPSYRFSNNEGPITQALRIPSNEKSTYISSTIDLQAVKKYAAYRRDVGLRE